MAREWPDIWNLISTHRMRHQGWSFSSTSSDAQDLHPALKISRAVVERNLDRARRRYIRACGNVTDRNVDGLENGTVLPQPSHD